MIKLNLKELVNDTVTNAAGASLAVQLDRYFKEKKRIELSMSDTLGISSSFFNSSFGHLIEVYGFSNTLGLIKITGVTSTQADLLRSYFNSYKNLSTE